MRRKSNMPPRPSGHSFEIAACNHVGESHGYMKKSDQTLACQIFSLVVAFSIGCGLHFGLHRGGHSSEQRHD